MAQRTLTNISWTPVAVADATNFTDQGYMIIQGGSSTQRIKVSEIFQGGQATASAPTFLVFGRDSTVGATVTAGTNGRDAATDPATAALAAPPVTGCAATTKPQRSATLGALLALPYNAFGGVVRWFPATVGGEIQLVGNTASLGELSLSAFTGGTPGLMGGHIVYEAS